MDNVFDGNNLGFDAAGRWLSKDDLFNIDRLGLHPVAT